MRNVKRIKKPLILKRKASSWTKELLRELGKGARADKKKLETIYRRYNIPDVKKPLDSMYKNLCCYCESTVGIVDYPHIEHRKPKKDFPKLTFDWDNLNLACGICNISKGDKYNKNAPILDAVIDKPITKHLEYEAEIGGIYRTPKTKKGKTTVEHTDLNRDALLRARLTVYLEIKL